jgi:hypothetical protein
MLLFNIYSPFWTYLLGLHFGLAAVALAASSADAGPLHQKYLKMQ